MDLGKAMGLQGADLSAFFRDEQATARARQREEQERADREQEWADRERERQHEKEQREHEKEQREHERHFLEERGRQELALAEANRSTDINHPGRQSETSPKLPHFDDKKDNMDAYLHRFEDYAVVQGWAEDKWAVNLSALLKGNALETYYRMDTEDRKDYKKLKAALLRRLGLTESGSDQSSDIQNQTTKRALDNMLLDCQVTLTGGLNWDLLKRTLTIRAIWLSLNRFWTCAVRNYVCSSRSVDPRQWRTWPQWQNITWRYTGKSTAIGATAMTEVTGKVKVRHQALVSPNFRGRSRGQSTEHRHPKLLASRALYVARLVTWLGIVLRRVQKEHRLDQGGGGGGVLMEEKVLGQGLLLKSCQVLYS